MILIKAPPYRGALACAHQVARSDTQNTVTPVVTESCIKCQYTDGVQVCPLECFHAAPNMRVIDPEECIDGTRCVEECSAEAIVAHEALPGDQADLLELNRVLAGRWPVRAVKIPAPPGAERWDGLTNTLPLLER